MDYLLVSFLVFDVSTCSLTILRLVPCYTFTHNNVILCQHYMAMLYKLNISEKILLRHKCDLSATFDRNFLQYYT